MKNSFVMYADWLDMVAELDDIGRSKLLMAILLYQNGMDIPDDMDVGARVAFACMKTQFDKDDEKYTETMKKRSEAGKTAARARIEASSRNESIAIATNRNESLHDNVNVNENDNENDKPKKKESDLKVTRDRNVRFIPPTVDEVRAYCAERGNAVDAETFVDFYESKGWMIGKNRMKDWKSAVRNWERSDRSGRQGKAAKQKSYMDAISERVKEVDSWI